MRISDWSSDVCSSDLSLSAVIGTRPPESELTGENFDPEAEQTLPEDPTGTADPAIQDPLGMAVSPLPSAIARPTGVDAVTLSTDESRVGKGGGCTCRFRGSPHPKQTN